MERKHQGTYYVVGFLFSPDHTCVALIRKTKPHWQAGKLNGIGGKVEVGELMETAMEREFREETGAAIPAEQWSGYCLMDGPGFTVECFAAVGDLGSLRSMEEEQVEILALHEITPIRKDLVENLPWMISLALDHLQDGRPEYSCVTYP